MVGLTESQKKRRKKNIKRKGYTYPKPKPYVNIQARERDQLNAIRKNHLKQMLRSKKQGGRQYRKELAGKDGEDREGDEQSSLTDPILAQRALRLNTPLLATNQEEEEEEGRTRRRRKSRKEGTTLETPIVTLGRRLSAQRPLLTAHEHSGKDLIREAERRTAEEMRQRREGTFEEEQEPFVHFNQMAKMDRGPSKYTKEAYDEVEPILMAQLMRQMEKRKRKQKRREEEEDDDDEDEEDDEGERKKGKTSTFRSLNIMKTKNKRLKRWQYKQMGFRDEAFIDKLISKYGRNNLKVRL
jgi:hypothetical protein